jgi:hypothetical protein
MQKTVGQSVGWGRGVVGAIVLSATAIGCRGPCTAAVAGVPIDGGASKEVVRRGRAPEDIAMNWDMDAPCRLDRLRLIMTKQEAEGTRLLSALRSDVENSQGIESWLSSCVQSAELYHVFLTDRRNNRVLYLLLKPCKSSDGRSWASLASYRSDGTVSVTDGTNMMAAIRDMASAR